MQWFFRFVTLAVLLGAPLLVRADVLDNLSVMTLSPADGKAVVRTNVKPLTVVGIGDRLFDSNYVVSQILTDRLLLKDRTKRGISNMIWVYRAKGGGTSRVQRTQASIPSPKIAVPVTNKKQ